MNQPAVLSGPPGLADLVATAEGCSYHGGATLAFVRAWRKASREARCMFAAIAPEAAEIAAIWNRERAA